jgi:hypothetical protein
MSAGPTDDGGYRLRATLPLGATALAPLPAHRVHG